MQKTEMSRSIGSGLGRTLLVVGPEDDTRAALAFLLEREGYEVAQARDQSEAIVRLETVETVTAIVLDKRVSQAGPGLTGALASRPELARIPVIVTSAEPYLEPSAIPPCFGGFFAEPLNVDALLGAVRYWSARSGDERPRSGGG